MESVLENITIDVIEKITNLGLVDDINSQVDDPSDRATLLQSIVDELVDEQIKDMINVVIGEDDDDDDEPKEDYHSPSPEDEIPEYVMPPSFEEQIGIIEEKDHEYALRLQEQENMEKIVADMKLRVRIISLLKINKDPFTDIKYLSQREQKKLLATMNSYSDTSFADICKEFNEEMCDILHDPKSTYETMPCYDDTIRSKAVNDINNTTVDTDVLDVTI